MGAGGRKGVHKFTHSFSPSLAYKSFIHSFTCTHGRSSICSVFWLFCFMWVGGQSPAQAYSPPGRAGTERALPLESDGAGFAFRLLTLLVYKWNTEQNLLRDHWEQQTTH